MKRKNSSRVWLLIVILAFMGILALAAAAGVHSSPPEDKSSKPRITLAAYGSAAQKNIIEDIARIYERDYDCTVDVYCYATQEALYACVTSQYAAGAPFDVFYLDKRTLIRLVDGGWLYPLDDVVAQRTEDGDEFYQTALIAGQRYERQYALPTGVNPYMLHYNATMLKRAGVMLPQEMLENKTWNFDCFEDYLRAIHEHTGNPALVIENNWSTLIGWLKTVDGQFLGIDRRGDIRYDYLGERTLDRLRDLIHKGIVAYLGDMYRGASLDHLFRSGFTPMVLADFGFMCRLYDVNWFEWDIAPMPSKDSSFSNTPVDVPMVAVCARSEQPRYAADFVDFYVSAFGQQLRIEQGESLLSSLNMTFYTSMFDVRLPDHANYYFYAIEYGYTEPSMQPYLNRRESVYEWFDHTLKAAKR